METRLSLLEDRTLRHQKIIDSINGDLKQIQNQISELSFYVKSNDELKQNISKVAWGAISAIVAAAATLYFGL